MPKLKLQQLQDLNPQPQAWPACSQCGEPYVLRRALMLDPKSASRIGWTVQWGWMRDCKHRKAEAVVQTDKTSKRGR